ncbi:unnamed protein product [Trypanosoma congolense IL3000]|uniref:WGS project CAEQ00000000 data, annotated contig 746 n=1 Tax=Trypanosoma congolense (strain IL3000) TaxID=1068625 RepID=F9WI87_TRYCI|nr:unnamed protein product [Trypanosoma congolense IL3000]
MWASIKKECENLLHQHPKSTKEGYEVLSDFFTHLKSGGVYRWGSRNVEGSNRKEGMLGTSGWKNGGYGSGPVCDGKKGSNGEHGGICVYYGPETQWEEDIDWLKKLKNALETVDDINNQTATIQRDIEKLQMLQHRAEEIYETAKVISKVQNPVGLTALPNANTKRLTAYNTAWRYHLLAPWVILIL